MADATYTLASGGTLDAQLSFAANTCIVDNFTNQYLYLGPSGRIIPPYSHTIVVPLPATEKGTAKFVTPPGIIPPPIKSGEAATLHYVATVHPASSAQSSFSQPSPQQVISSTSFTSGVVIPTTTVTIPTGTLALGVVATSNSGHTSDPTGGLTIRGVQSGIAYQFSGTALVNVSGGSSNGFYTVVVIFAALDTAVTIAGSSAPSDSGTLTAIAFFDQAMVGLFQSSGIPFTVQPTTPGATGGPAAPLAANILAGETEAANGTIITIPQNRVWTGSVWVTALAGASSSLVAVATTGVTVTPAATNVCTLDVGPNLSGSTSVANVTVAAGSNAGAATLQLQSFGGVPARLSGGAAGVLY